jgi:hypothetical protein
MKSFLITARYEIVRAGRRSSSVVKKIALQRNSRLKKTIGVNMK